MTSGLIQYTWTVEERRKDRIKQAFYTAYEKYTAGYMEHIKSLVKTCSNCHNETIKSVNVLRNDNGLVIVWKCQTCGRIVRTFENEEELIGNFRRALKKH